ncbi:MAG: hypothetical protein ACTSRG_22295, partial [Candidatus Helarchaeota archaeon]
LSQKVEELAEAQKRTDSSLGRLSQKVEELAEAQKRTETKVEELVEAQKRTDSSLGRLSQKVEELAEAQKRTELSVKILSQEVGKLSSTIGFGLEDVARVVLPGVLEKYKGIKVTEFQRKFIDVDSEKIEINLYGEGIFNQKDIILIGDSKSRIYSNEVNSFLKQVAKIEKIIKKPIFKFMFGFFIHPSAQDLADSNDIYLVVSYMK